MEEAETIKNGKKELKYLEIDYNQYKDWPAPEEEEVSIGNYIEKTLT